MPASVGLFASYPEPRYKSIYSNLLGKGARRNRVVVRPFIRQARAALHKFNLSKDSLRLPR